MTCVLVWLWVAALAVAAPGDGGAVTWERADELLVTGEYAEAASAYESLGREATRTADKVATAVGGADALRMMGKYGAALGRLEAIDFADDRRGDARVARARVLAETGRLEEALAELERALESYPQQSTARRLTGEWRETRGEYAQAIEAYAWFEALLKRGYPASATVLVDAGIAMHRLTVLRQDAGTAETMRYVLHELLQPAYERVDKRCWPALVASADLLLSKYNLREAAGDYEAALKINPHLVDAHVGLGLIALEGWQFEEVEKRVEAALKANPGSVAGFRLKARLHLTERKYSEAQDAARRALETNSRDIEALGLLAAAATRAGDGDTAALALQRAREVVPGSARPSFEMGQWLAAGRQFAEAEIHFQRAIELAPHEPYPRTALGLMYMEIGDERAARRALQAAWRLDPYNAETKNTLDLLDTLDRFTSDTTEHFQVKSLDGADAAVRGYMAAYLESIHAEIAGKFGGEPPQRTTIEIFPDHRAFAVRITAKPWIHTIGACTGPVIAMDAPRSGDGAHPFNWARVLRHEYVHTVTLAATRNRIPHWLTEGLATWSENSVAGERSLAWREMLAMAYRRGRLFDLTTIDFGFARPRRHDDRTLAYAQSEWMVEYLIATRGFEVFDPMLKALAAGDSQEDVFRSVVGAGTEAFIRAFRAWAGGEIASWGMSAEVMPSIEELRSRIGAAGGEAAREQALLAEALLDEGEVEEAEKAARAAVEHGAAPAKGYEVLLDVLGARAPREGDAGKRKQLGEEAKTLAGKLLDLDEDNVAALRTLAGVALNEMRAEGGAHEHGHEEHGHEAEPVTVMDPSAREDARRYLERLRAVQPLELMVHRGLLKVLGEDASAEELLPVLTALANLDYDRAAWPKRIADLHADAGRMTEAVAALRQAVFIEPYDEALHERLGDLLMQVERFGEAASEFEVLTRLEPGVAAHHSRLAFALHRGGDKEAASVAAKRAVALDPESEAKSLAGE